MNLIYLPTTGRYAFLFGGPDGSLIAIGGRWFHDSHEAAVLAAQSHGLTVTTEGKVI